MVKNYLDNFPNLYCVGRNGQHRYNNMDHCMMTSFETVKTILAGKTDKTKIWAVNRSSVSYHDSTSLGVTPPAEQARRTVRPRAPLSQHTSRGSSSSARFFPSAVPAHRTSIT